MRDIRINIATLCCSLALVPPALPAAATGERFGLGEILVLGKREMDTAGIGGVSISAEEAWTYQRPALDELVNVAPGVSSTLDANGRRNESDVFVRGFNRLQVPLMIDGVRVYLPADNRLDFGRFLTADIAEVQIQKGYASVIDGPGMMGGAINLVTRVPTKTFEAQAQGGFSLDRSADLNEWNGYLRAGSRQERYYVQGSASYRDRDFWTLPASYDPVPRSLEDGGRRQGSDIRDWGINLKAGLTPNDSDEYTLNYTRQDGRKGAPLNVFNNPPVPGNSFWRWPWWNVQSTSLLTNTQLGSASSVKTNLYYNTFENALDAFDDISYTTRGRPGRFRSYYDDHAYGGSVELATELIPRNTLKAAFHYRVDVHEEYNLNRPSDPRARSLEPVQTQSQDTWSVAVENTLHVTQAVDLVGGLSYDKYWVNDAEEFDSATQRIFERPLGGADAFNWQFAGIWRYRDSGQAHLSVSDRARFPTIFELYSTRFGTAVPNPDLEAERATNIELGVRDELLKGLRAEAAIFYSDVRDLIQTVQIGPGTTQTQNVGDGAFYGTELALDASLRPGLELGGNYTFIRRDVTDPSQPRLKPTGVPTHKGFVYLRWAPLDKLTVTPSLELASSRWSDVDTNPVSPFPFIETGAYTLGNVQVDYAMLRNLDAAVGARNLFDDEYELAWGLPQPGRTFYVKARIEY
ncbi:MAG TPA: TonB-dependent receptor [Gammaproteobacteria bacterium]|mgnify:CR=1 FL=1|nr:TonB-dependent receptor [Gammaproteobacteria bacterium]